MSKPEDGNARGLFKISPGYRVLNEGAVPWFLRFLSYYFFSTYFNGQMAYLRSKEVWRMAVFQKSGKQEGEIQNAITLVLILPDTVTQQQAVATGSSHPSSGYRTPMKGSKNLRSW